MFTSAFGLVQDIWVIPRHIAQEKTRPLDFPERWYNYGATSNKETPNHTYLWAFPVIRFPSHPRSQIFAYIIISVKGLGTYNSSFDTFSWLKEVPIKMLYIIGQFSSKQGI